MLINCFVIVVRDRSSVSSDLLLGSVPLSIIGLRFSAVSYDKEPVKPYKNVTLI